MPGPESRRPPVSTVTPSRRAASIAAHIAESWASLITGPKSSSSPQPTRSFATRRSSRSRNASYTESNTMIRLPAAQRWPALLNAERTAASAARSRSASSQTISGFFPPSSRHTFASRAPAACAIQRPTAVEPVKLMRSTSGDSTSAAPASSPSPCTTLSTPGGRPASCASRAKAHALSGVSSAGLSTAAFPQRSAGKTFHATLAIGVFAAMMRPVTPSGWRTVWAVLLGIALVVVRP